jgi:hypothetical protein
MSIMAYLLQVEVSSQVEMTLLDCLHPHRRKPPPIHAEDFFQQRADACAIPWKERAAFSSFAAF